MSDDTFSDASLEPRECRNVRELLATVAFWRKSWSIMRKFGMATGAAIATTVGVLTILKTLGFLA